MNSISEIFEFYKNMVYSEGVSDEVLINVKQAFYVGFYEALKNIKSGIRDNTLGVNELNAYELEALKFFKNRIVDAIGDS